MFVMEIEDTIATGIPVWRKMVENAGGQWVGVQMPIFGDGAGIDRDPVVLFLTPFSSNPVYISIYHITEDDVKQKLGVPVKHKKTQDLRVFAEELRLLLNDFSRIIQKMEEY